MSLVEDGYLLELWKEAQKPSSLESASVAFWNQLFSKYIFAEKVIIWVKWTPNLAHFAAALCSLRTRARHGSNSAGSGLCTKEPFLDSFPLPSLSLLTSVSKSTE